VTAYVIDCYGEHVSSAMAARQFSSSLMAFLFPLFAPSLYGKVSIIPKESHTQKEN
jgi:hypothetical protein